MDHIAAALIHSGGNNVEALNVAGAAGVFYCVGGGNQEGDFIRMDGENGGRRGWIFFYNCCYCC